MTDDSLILGLTTIKKKKKMICVPTVKSYLIFTFLLIYFKYIFIHIKH